MLLNICDNTGSIGCTATANRCDGVSSSITTLTPEEHAAFDGIAFILQKSKRELRGV